ncbi:MAG: acyl-CoA thioesterase [Pseudomonadota bacterium]
MMDRKPPSKRSEFAVFEEIQTRWTDNDCYGHMNNAVHYSLFDSIINSWLIRRGFLDPHKGEMIGLVVQSGCAYHAELGYPDIITAGLRIARIGNSSVQYEIGLFRNNSETSAADGFFVHAFVDAQSRKPIALSKDQKQMLLPLTQTA